MMLSLNRAAKRGKVAKTTLLSALKNGDVTGVKDVSGQWRIDTSELDRWASARSREQGNTGSENDDETPEKPPETSALEREIELLRERLNDKDDVITDLRERLDEEGSERRRLTAILTDQREKTDPPREPWFKLGALRLGGNRE